MSQEAANNITAAMAGVLLRHAEREVLAEQGAVLSSLKTIVKKHRDGLSSDRYLLLLELAEVTADMCLNFRSNDFDDAKANKSSMEEAKRLQKRYDEITYRLAISAEVDHLLNAKSLEEFNAVLPTVPLGQLHGPTNKISRFPLIWAISSRNRPLERVQSMLAAGARLDLKTTGLDTVLHAFAAMKRKAKVRGAILRLLVFKGAPLETFNKQGQTPLTVAIEDGSTEDVVNFIAVGATVRKRDLEGAVYAPDKLRILLDHITDDAVLIAEAAQLGGWLRGEIAHWKQYSREAIAAGAKGDFHSGTVEKLEESLKMVSSLPGYLPAGKSSKVTWGEEPAAFTAVQEAETLDAFRDALARVHISTYGIASNGDVVKAGDHPIYWPIRDKNDRLERLWLMLSAGASVKGRGGNGEALHIFASEPRKDEGEQHRMAQMLVQAGAEIDANIDHGTTPLAIAVSRGGYAEAAALLKLGASPIVEYEWKTLSGPRFHAPLVFVAADEPKIFRLFLDHGVETNGRDSMGRSLPDYLQAAIDEAQRHSKCENMSGNLKRRVNRTLRALLKSQKMLTA